ncbi:GGDEF domain-containing protein [uncultured Clostridium sp.]|uniref:GGDEF domain-containing protein n=1 Tax=uncultured Clostridium sp. TaxID=59620 RepID=UPI0028E6485B|nr:GGDEF domain-containing protein [uncultured Clostridium sp.]
MLVILLLVSMVINIILVIYAVMIKKKSLRNNDSSIIKEILDKVSTNELNFVDSSAVNIIHVLKKHYKIDYCTILIKNMNKLSIIASDVDELHQGEVESRCSELLNRTKGRAIINAGGDTFLDYNSAMIRAIKYSYFIPLGSIGALYIENFDNYVNNKFEVEFFNIVAKNIGIILQNCIYQDTISNLAMKDNLTNMYNRNYMDKHIKILLKNNRSLLIAIMDLDHFKSVNDSYGHDFGDLVLKTCSNYIKDNLENDDEIYRWGGEEFIISFCDQDINTVVNKLNLIREGLSNYSISDGKNTLKITASFGVAYFEKAMTLEECIKKADNGLYLSKSNGRNQINIG